MTKTISVGLTLLAALSTVALAVLHGPVALPVASATAAPLAPTTIEPAIMRAAAALTAAAVRTSPSPNSGEPVAAAGDTCIVKPFAPQELKAVPHQDQDPWRTQDEEPTFFFQNKLICTTLAGVSELLIEQNDQLVVAETITNNQTFVTLHNLTVTLNHEQRKVFCLAIARQTDASGAFSIVDQECYSNLADSHGGG